MRPRPVAVAIALVLVLVTGCTDDSGVTSGTSSNDTSGATSGATDDTSSSSGSEPATPRGTLEWADFGDNGRVQTSNLEVPIDHDDPSKGTIDLYLARHLADPDQRIGSLLVNPGGPGFGGTDWAIYAEQVYSDELLDRFDIVGWDPRGTGLSTPAVDCIDDYDRYYTGIDITPDDDSERQAAIDLAEDFTEQCLQRSGEVLPYVGTNNSARDMDSIRRALGEAKISYFGFSYGSELGTTWATLFPDTVRAIAVDGAADPNVDAIEAGLQQVRGFERALATFLAQCSDDDDCAFHSDGDAEGAFDTLMSALDEQPIPTEDDRPDLTRSMALTAAAEAMYVPERWPVLAQALAAAEQGDGSGLLALFDSYFQRQDDGSWPNVLEAFQVITCMDDATRMTVEEEDAITAEFRAAAPRFAPNTIGGYSCTFFPPAEDPRIEITAKGAGPVLVMGTTGDPATPIEGTRSMAETLEDGRLVVVTAEGHGGYGTSTCATEVIDRYLIDPVANAPEDGTTCD